MKDNPRKHTSLKHGLILYLLIPLAVIILRLIGLTLRVKLLDPHHAAPQAKPLAKYIYSFWHNQQLLATYFFRNFNIRVLVSRSWDGDYIAKALEAFGFATVRSSTSQGKINALRGLARELKAGYHVAITPDGPRGPVYQVQPGAIFLSALSGQAVVPFGSAVERVWKLHRSWDKFEIPQPFSRSVIIFGEPFLIPRHLSDEQIRTWTQTLQNQLQQLRQQALEDINQVKQP